MKSVIFRSLFVVAVAVGFQSPCLAVDAPRITKAIVHRSTGTQVNMNLGTETPFIGYGIWLNGVAIVPLQAGNFVGSPTLSLGASVGMYGEFKPPFVLEAAVIYSDGQESPRSRIEVADFAGGGSLYNPPSGPFVKHGNNGTVSCNQFCENAGSNWGQAGKCVGATLVNVPCHQTIGLLKNGAALTCVCVDQAGSSFEKGFNNGTVSCDSFCAGPQWGPVGQCVFGESEFVPCDATPGLLSNGSEMSCLCQ